MSDIPILVARGDVPGSGPRVEWASKISAGGTFAEEKAKRARFDLGVAKGIGVTLHSMYPKHFWNVEVDSHQGVAMIGIAVLLGNWKYVIRLEDLTPAMVKKAGGEILERFNIPRSSLDVAAFVAARERRVSRASDRPPGGIV